MGPTLLVQGDTRVESITESKKNRPTQNVELWWKKNKKKPKTFSALTWPKIPSRRGESSPWDELARYLSARWQPELVIMPHNHQNQHNFSSTLTALMHCYCFSILTGSACWVCWNQGPLLSSFNFSSSMPCRRKKIKEEERWKFWNKPFLLHDSDI